MCCDLDKSTLKWHLQRIQLFIWAIQMNERTHMQPTKQSDAMRLCETKYRINAAQHTIHQFMYDLLQSMEVREAEGRMPLKSIKPSEDKSKGNKKQQHTMVNRKKNERCHTTLNCFRMSFFAFISMWVFFQSRFFFSYSERAIHSNEMRSTFLSAFIWL